MQPRDSQDQPLSYHFETGKPKKPELNVWQQLSRIMEVVIYILIVLIVAKHFSPELERRRELQQEFEELSALKKNKEEEVARLRREHTNLSSDRLYLESVARDRLNLQMKEEWIIQIER